MINNTTPELAVVKSIEISASTNDVWRALTEPDKIAQWVGGARVESKWEVGRDITFTGEMPKFKLLSQQTAGHMANRWILRAGVRNDVNAA